jgi:hypothetical protein
MSVFHRLWELWKHFGRWVGDQVARIIFTAIYLIVALPFGLGVRLLSDPLGRRSAPTWQTKPDRGTALEDARRLF